MSKFISSFFEGYPEAKHFSTPSPPCPLSHCADLSGLLPVKASHPLRAKPERGQSQAQLQRLPSLTTEFKPYTSRPAPPITALTHVPGSPPSPGPTCSGKTPHSEPQGLGACFPQGASLPPPFLQVSYNLPTLRIYLTHHVFSHLLSFPTLDEVRDLFYYGCIPSV